jgi:4-amino-4-deoxy-L-arabinose transferase-like glycosyltransferase
LSDSPKIDHRRQRRVIAGCTLAIFVCLFAHLGAVGLVGPDEPRYAWIARAMATTGDWVTPKLYGEPWFEKPVLYYWAAGAGFLLHLPAEWAARLPSALAALAAAIAIGLLGRKFYGNESSVQLTTAALAPLVFSSSIAAIGFARGATPDMLFSATLALAMAAAAHVLQARGSLRSAVGTPKGREGQRFALGLFGLFLGLAVLAKGPAGVVLAAGAMGLWAMTTKRWRSAFHLAHPVALASFCVIALPWYVLCALRNPEFLRVFIFQHNFERYLTPLFQHRQPFWFFVPITLLAILPWTALLWPAAKCAFKMWQGKTFDQSPSFFFGCWAIFPVVFFSFSESKLPGYILPAVPALALLLSAALARADGVKTPNEFRLAAGSGMAIGLTWIGLGCGVLLWMKRLTPAMRGDLETTLLIAAGLAILGGLAVASSGIIRKRIPVILIVALSVLGVEIAGTRILPSLDPYISARWHAQFVRNDVHPERIFCYQLPRAWTYGLAFYLGRELPEWNPQDPEPALVLTTPKGLEEMTKIGRFQGEVDETYKGILYVPAFPARH